MDWAIWSSAPRVWWPGVLQPTEAGPRRSCKSLWLKQHFIDQSSVSCCHQGDPQITVCSNPTGQKATVITPKQKSTAFWYIQEGNRKINPAQSLPLIKITEINLDLFTIIVPLFHKWNMLSSFSLKWWQGLEFLRWYYNHYRGSMVY